MNTNHWIVLIAGLTLLGAIFAESRSVDRAVLERLSRLEDRMEIVYGHCCGEMRR